MWGGGGVLCRWVYYVPISFFHGGLPAEDDGIWLAIGDGEVTHSKCRWQDGTLQGTASWHSLVSVQSRTWILAKHLRDQLLDGWDTGRSTNNLNWIDIFCLQLWKHIPSLECNRHRMIMKNKSNLPYCSSTLYSSSANDLQKSLST